MTDQVETELFAPYVAALVRREKLRRRRLRERAKDAREMASTTADLLRSRFGATRVRLFGSVLTPERFHERSDIDLAVEGIAPADFWKACAAVTGPNAKFDVELVDMSDCPPYLRDVIEREGEVI